MAIGSYGLYLLEFGFAENFMPGAIAFISIPVMPIWPYIPGIAPG